VAEKYYRIYHTLHDLQTVVLRFANLFGPYGKGFQEFGFINYFIHQARTDQEIRIFGSGSQTRNILYVEDAVDLLWRAAREPGLTGGSYFATSEEHLSVREIAETIVQVFKSGRVVHIDWPEERKRIEVEHMVFSSARLRSIIDWKPEYNLKSGLQQTKSITDPQI